jgi:hypothetical protein
VQRSSRIEAGRRRAEAAKRGVAVVAAAGFVAAVLLARVSHPGQAATGSTATTGSSSADEGTEDGGFSFDQGSFGPSTSAAPQVQTHVS